MTCMRVLIITADRCDDSELFYPYFRLMEEDFEIEIASFSATRVHAKYHFEIDASIAVSDVDAARYDALLLPGGLAPEKLRQDESVIKIVQKFMADGKPISAICHGQQILISAGVLRGIHATCYPGIKDDLVNCGAIYENKSVVVDKNIITSRRPEDLPYFMRETVRMLKEIK